MANHENPGKVFYLEGIRGVAAFCVFLHHFCLAFYPAYFDGNPQRAHFASLEVSYYRGIFCFITNGKFWVAIFFILSGFVLSRKYFNDNSITTLVSAAQRRFLRLFIPVGFTVILAFTLMKMGLFHHIEVSKLTKNDWWLPSLWTIDTNFGTLLQHLAYNVMFFADGRGGAYDTTLWTMPIELFGSLLVFAALALTQSTVRRVFALVLLLYFFLVTGYYSGPLYFQYYYCAFILGILLNYVERRPKSFGGGIPLLPLVLVALGLLLGTFPETGFSVGTIWEKTVSNEASKQFPVPHIIGSFLVIWGFVISPGMQKLFSKKIFVFLGFISFSLYLLHPLIIGTFSSSLFLNLSQSMTYNSAGFMVLLLSTAVVLALSWAMAKYVDSFGLRVSKQYYQHYIREITEKKKKKQAEAV